MHQEEGQNFGQGYDQSCTREQATALLTVQKERAQNLMIVDLTRHDLHGVVSADKVSVKDLMVIEEYETVYQLVVVIEAKSSITAPLASSGQDSTELPKTGLDVFAVSLPSGCMTGAPKRRSCQLLQTVEDYEPCSVSSDVLGYMRVSGKRC